MWREWADPVSGRPHGPFRTFEHFVITPVRDGGLGSTIAQLLGLCESDVGARDAITEATRREAHRPPKTLDNIQGSAAPTGTSESAALRRLRKEREDLHAEVLAGNLSAHAAMVQAGYRPRTVSVPVTRPDAVARALRKHMTPGDLARLVILLSEGGRA